MTTEQWPSQPPAEQASSWSYATEPVPVEEGRRRRLPILVAAATVLAVVLGGAAYAGLRLWYGTGAQPEEAMPASMTAFARLDLSPGYGQRLKLNDLIKKFPRESGKDAVDELETSIFDSFGIEEEAYRKHIEPWFGKRIGVGLWFDSAKKPYGLVVLNSTDDAKARAGLTEVLQGKKAKDFGFVVRDGHALLANGEKGGQAAAEAAAAEAQRESLAASAQFRRGTAWLPGQQTGLAWVDFDRLGTFADTIFNSTGALTMAPGGLLGLPTVPGASGADGPKGQMIIGGSATDNGVEFRFRAFGMGASVPADDVQSNVDSLPGDTALAASVRLGEFGDLEELLPEELLEEGNPFAALSGARLTVALATLGDEMPPLSASADATSAEHAKSLAAAIGAISAGEVTVTTNGNRVELKTKGYAPGGGKLSGQELYREALAGAPDRAYAVIYVDVQRLLADTKMSEKERREFAAVKAVGLAAGAEDGDPVGLLRVVIR